MKWWTIALVITLALSLAGCDNAYSGGGIGAGCPDPNCSAYRP